MAERSANDRREQLLARMAELQHGVISRAQLVDLDFGDDAIARFVRIGRLHRLHPSVYAVGHRILGPNGRRKAATLSVRDSVVGDRYAGAFHALRPYSGVPELIVKGDRGCRARPGVRVRRVRHLHPADVTVIDAIPVTTVARTLLDCAVVVGDGVGRMITRAEQREVFDLNEVRAAIDRAPRHRGTKPLLAALAALHPESAWTRSDLELAMLALCAQAGLPAPVCNAMVEGFEVDFLWTSGRLVGEADSWEFHKTRAAFQRDRLRDRALLLAGYRVLRFTYADVEHHPDRVLADLRRALGS